MDYVNSHHLKDKTKPWCGSNKATKQYVSQHGAHIVCRPISKSRVEKFCKSHHLAIRINGDNAEPTGKQLQDTTSTYQIKIIGFSDYSSEGHGRILQQLAVSENNDSPDVSKKQPQFLLNHVPELTDIWDLFNFLEINITDYLLNSILSKFNQTLDKGIWPPTNK